MAFTFPDPTVQPVAKNPETGIVYRWNAESFQWGLAKGSAGDAVYVVTPYTPLNGDELPTQGAAPDGELRVGELFYRTTTLELLIYGGDGNWFQTAVDYSGSISQLASSIATVQSDLDTAESDIDDLETAIDTLQHKSNPPPGRLFRYVSGGHDTVLAAGSFSYYTHDSTVKFRLSNFDAMGIEWINTSWTADIETSDGPMGRITHVRGNEHQWVRQYRIKRFDVHDSDILFLTSSQTGDVKFIDGAAYYISVGGLV